MAFLPKTSAQVPPFENISSDQGLSQGVVLCMMQDSKGFLWAGTKAGLNRYDGYSFRVFRHNPFDTLSIPDNRVVQMLEDRSGRIWIITAIGLTIFDPRQEIFQPIRLRLNTEAPFLLNEITSLREDAVGAIWVRLGSSFFRLTLPRESFDLSKLKIQRIETGHPPLPEFPSVLVNDAPIQFSDSNYLVPNHNELSVLTFHPAKGGMTLSPDVSGLPSQIQSSMKDPGWKSIHAGKNGSIWLCHAEGMVQFNGTRVIRSIPGLGYLVPGWNPRDIGSITEDQHGNLVIALSTGLVFCDATHQVEFRIGEDLGIQDYRRGPVFFDRADILWIGTNGSGLYKSDFSSIRFSVSRSRADQVLAWEGPSVRAVMQSTSGDIFIGPNGEEQILVRYASSGKSAVVRGSKNSVTSFYEDAHGIIWAGGLNLSEIDKDANGKWEVKKDYRIPKHHYPSGVKIVETADSVLWVVTIENLCKFDRGTKTFSCIDLPEAQSPMLYFARYPALMEDVNGYLWIGTSDGLQRFDPKNQSFVVYRNDPSNPQSLASDNVQCIESDPIEPKRYLWIGHAGGGLDKFDMTTGRCKHFGVDQGLSDLVVNGILSGEDHNLWISTNFGLTVLNPQTEIFKTLDKKEGLLHNEFNATACSKTRDGVMLFGNIRGFNRFQPERVHITNQLSPPVALTAFRVSNKLVNMRQGKFPYQENIAYARQIKIPWRYKSFSIEFTALDFTAPDKNQFRYKLDRFDSDWQNALHDRSATYTNLDPGKYTFHVKASNNDGVWNEDGISLSIIILPPWFRTWWAYSLYLCLLGGFIMFIRRKEMQGQQLKHQVAVEQIKADKLQEIDQMKSRFFANISHEFRTPLTLIQGHLEKAEQHSGDTMLKESIHAASQSTKKLHQLINELLALAKLQAGKMTLELHHQDILPFLKNILYAFESLAAQRHIELGFVSEKERIVLAFDADKLEKVFINLLSNAFKFTPEGGKITMTVDQYVAEGKGPEPPCQLIVTVRDTGIGIPKEALDQVFDRFYQVESSLTRKKEGTGIGLALVEELVMLHGGHVSVQSTENEGSVFTVKLPFLQEPGSNGEKAGTQASPFVSQPKDTLSKIWIPDEEMETVELNGQGAEVNGDALRLLVVEDNPDVRKFLRDQLTAAGYKVVLAKNGEEGFAVARESLPDLIITDVMMPVLDGYSFTRLVRSEINTSHIPIIMLTARASEEDKLEALDTGIDTFLTKPYSTKELLASVSNLLRQRQLLRDRFKSATRIHPSEVSVVPMDQVFLEKVIQAIEAQMGESSFGVKALSEAVHMSPNNLHLKLTALIQQSPGEFMRSLRLQRAAELLAKQAGNVNEIAYSVGFSVPENFSRSFKKQFGVTPTEYAQRRQL